MSNQDSKNASISEEKPQSKITSSKELLTLEYVNNEPQKIVNSLLEGKKQLNTFQVQSKVLSKVKDLLPKLQESEEQLKLHTKDELDIENVDDLNGPVIEMNLLLLPEMVGLDESDSEESISDSSSSDESDMSDSDKEATIPPKIEELQNNG